MSLIRKYAGGEFMFVVLEFCEAGGRKHEAPMDAAAQ